MIFTAQPKHLISASVLLLGALAVAQTPAPKPANATGQCKDGTYSNAASKSGACRGHNGVKDWYAAAVPSTAAPIAAPSSAQPTPSSSAAKPASLPAASSTPTPTAATPPAKPSASTAKGPRANLANTPAAPGGGPGLVWVNTSSNVYHCPGTDFYGKTKAGSYMTEAAAKGKGARPDHGNACSK